MVRGTGSVTASYRGKHLVFFFEKNIKRVRDKSLTKIQFAFEINGVRSCFYHCYEVWLSVLTEF